MVKGAHVKVALDTEPAKKDLRELGKQGEATARRVNRRTKGTAGGAGGGSGGFGQGFGLGAGFALGRKVAGSVGVFSAVGEVMGEKFAGLGEKVGGALGVYEARARKGAREETSQAFALQAYYADDTARAKEFYNSILSAKHMPQQLGAHAINTALTRGDAVAPELKGPLDKLLDPIVDKISSGFDMVIKALGG